MLRLNPLPQLSAIAGTAAAAVIRWPYRLRAWVIRALRGEPRLRVALTTFGWTPMSGGAGNYMMSLILGWSDLEPGNPLRLYATKSVFDHLKRLPLRRRIYARCLTTSSDLRREPDRFDIHCQIGHLEPVPPPRRAVYNLADLQERFFPEFFTEKDRRDRADNHLAGLRHAWRIITGSEFTRVSFAELLDMPEGLSALARLPVADLPSVVRRPAALPEKTRGFLYYPADDFLHKNHRRVMRATALLRSEGHDVSLVCTGGRFSGRDLTAMAAEEGLDGTFHDLGKVSREEVSWLYRHSKLLFFGTLFEGFGLPVLEAFLCGTPVACSGVTSLPEIGGRAAVYFNPLDAAHMASRVARLLGEPRERERLVQEGYRQSRQFSLPKVIAMHKDVFSRVQQQKERIACHPADLPPVDTARAWRLYVERAEPAVRENLPAERPASLLD